MLERELRSLQQPLGPVDDLVAFLLRDALRHAPGNRRHHVDRLAAEDLHDVVGCGPSLDHDLAGVDAEFVDHAEDVAFRRRRLGAHDEVGPSQDEEVREVIAGEERRVHQLAELPRSRGNLHVERVVARLGRGQVMGLAAHAADPRRDPRHLLDRASDAECLEAAQLGNDEEAVRDLAIVVDEDVDLAVALESGDRIDQDLLHGSTSANCGFPGRFVDGDSPQRRSSHREPVERSDGIDDTVENAVDLLGIL